MVSLARPKAAGRPLNSVDPESLDFQAVENSRQSVADPQTPWTVFRGMDGDVAVCGVDDQKRWLLTKKQPGGRAGLA